MFMTTASVKFRSMRLIPTRMLCATLFLLTTPLCCWQAASAQFKPDAYPQPETSDALDYYAYLLEELDQRRRLQFLLPNPQSIFDGLAIGYVQTSAGNLTFERRDLVVLGVETVVASRVYDSRFDSDMGFGSG